MAIAGALVGAYELGRRAASPPSSDVAVPPGAGSAPIAQPPPGVAAPADADADPASGPDPGVPVVTGVVLGPDGRPAPGAAVLVGGPYLHPPVEVSTDAAGAFAVPCGASRGRVDIWAHAAGAASPVQEGVAPALGGAAGAIRVRLAPAASLAGRIVRARDGAAVAGAIVRASVTWPAVLARSAQSRADGAFDLGAISEPRLHLSVSAAGFRSVVGLPVEHRGEEVRVALTDGAAADVAVVDGDDRPVPGARVRAEDDLPTPTALTDGSGRARLTGLPPGRSEIVARAADGRTGRSGPVVLSEGVALEVRVVLRPGRAVQGRVVDEDGAAVRGARIRVGGEGGPVVASDGEGRFLVRTEGDDLDLAVEAAGYLRTVTSVGAGPAEAVVRLTRPFRPLGGSVRSPAGGEVPGATVQVSAAGGSAAARTDGEGRFELHPAFAGPYRARATHPEYAPSDPTPVPEDGEVTVTVKPAYDLVVRVVADEDDDAVPNARVAVSGPERREIESGGDGLAVVRRLPAGTYVVGGSAQGRVPVAGGARVLVGPQADPAQAVLRLPPAGRLVVAVRDADTGDAPPGCWAEVAGVRLDGQGCDLAGDALPVGPAQRLRAGAPGFDTVVRPVAVLQDEPGREEVFVQRGR